MKEIQTLINECKELYNKANEVVVKLESTTQVGRYPLIYQLRDSFDHFMDALQVIEFSSKDYLCTDLEKAKKELKSCKAHLIRVIFDASELCVLTSLNFLTRKTRFTSPKIIKEVYPQFYVDYPNLVKNKSKIEELKLIKSTEMKMEELDELVEIAKKSLKIRKDFECARKLLGKETFKSIGFWVIGIVITAIVTASITKWISNS